MMTWNESYLMGVEELDNEHKNLFKIANQILEKTRARGEEPTVRMFLLKEGLTYLNSYFAGHAAREEAFMKQIGYEGYALHKMQHDDFQKVQLEKYRKMVDRGSCSKEEIWDFIGSGIGWLLQHITTADMAIVGKGVLSGQGRQDINVETIENAINSLFVTTLNVQANAKIISTAYDGAPFGKAVCQRFVLERAGRLITLVSGIERSFMMDVAQAIYGSQAVDEMDLVLSTVETFGAQFWVTLYRQLTSDPTPIDIKENKFLIGNTLADEIRSLNPTSSLLFTSDKGKFFIATNSEVVFLEESREALAM